MQNRLQLTPVKKLVNNLSSLSPDDQNKIPLVFVVTGALNPIHLDHILLFDIAKEVIENHYNEKYAIIGGFVSPSQGRYVNSKVEGNQAISVKHRINMAKLATRESTWIDVDEWEAKTDEFCGNFIDNWQVVRRLQSYLNSEDCVEVKEVMNNTGVQPIRVMYLCGSDLVKRTGAKGLEDNGIFVVERNDPADQTMIGSWQVECERLLANEYGDKVQDFAIFANSDDDLGISSTKIRTMIFSGQPEWKDMCSDEVVNYIEENNIFGLEIYEETKLSGKKKCYCSPYIILLIILILELIFVLLIYR